MQVAHGCNPFYTESASFLCAGSRDKEFGRARSKESRLAPPLHAYLKITRNFYLITRGNDTTKFMQIRDVYNTST